MDLDYPSQLLSQAYRLPTEAFRARAAPPAGSRT
jgi:hypothetical protein